jgi:DNA repair protein RecO (recombination protein O)
MEWSERGLILGLKKHGETSVILELMTRAHGRHLGVVRGGRSKTMQPVLQPGNEVEAVWRARLEEHLGLYAVEAATLRTDLLLSSPQSLHGVNWLAALLRLLPERDPHPHLFDKARVLLGQIATPLAPALFVHFELALLAELGFGLDLSECAATGSRDNLIYVSPKSGRAVSAEAGAPWAAKLLLLPKFLSEAPGAPASGQAIRDGFRLTEYFLMRDILAPRGKNLPNSRAAIIGRLET